MASLATRPKTTVQLTCTANEWRVLVEMVRRFGGADPMRAGAVEITIDRLDPFAKKIETIERARVQRDGEQ